MKFTLNTLGAPGWTLEDVARNARTYGYAGVDVRLIDGDVISLESVRANRGRLRALFQDADLPIAVLATSVKLATADPEVRRKTAEEMSEWVDLAAELGVPVIRVFGGMRPEGLDTDAATIARALADVPSRGVGAVWDMYHTARMGETPAEALSLVGDRLLNVHLKDARRNGDSLELCLLGEGDLPVKDALRLLKDRGYDDFVSVEWEKKWH